MLNVALPKGRLGEKVYEMLERAGYECPQIKENDIAANEGSLFRWKNLGESLAANWGAGVRLDLDFLLLRIDLGLKLHDPARTDKWVRPEDWFRRDGFALHFGVGYPF